MAVPYLVDVRDELPLAGHVHLLVVGSHLALDGEEQNLQVSLLCEPAGNKQTYSPLTTTPELQHPRRIID